MSAVKLTKLSSGMNLMENSLARMRENLLSEIEVNPFLWVHCHFTIMLLIQIRKSFIRLNEPEGRVRTLHWLVNMSNLSEDNTCHCATKMSTLSYVKFVDPPFSFRVNSGVTILPFSLDWINDKQDICFIAWMYFMLYPVRAICLF